MRCRYSERPSSPRSSRSKPPKTTAARRRGNGGVAGAAACLARAVRVMRVALIAVPLQDLGTRPAPGNCICNCSRAIFSTRAGIAHVDCSI